METEREYVVRKLAAKELNLSEVARINEMDRLTLLNIRDGKTKNPGARTIGALYKYFKALSE